MKHLLLLSCLLLTACNLTTEASLSDRMNLIALAEENAPEGVKGTFKFLIKGSGYRNGTVYLNTESDYRDRRSITVALAPKVADEFTYTVCGGAGQYFLDKTIEVTGEAKRVKIYFYANGKKTNKYYFQTHIEVSSLEQINIVG